MSGTHQWEHQGIIWNQILLYKCKVIFVLYLFLALSDLDIDVRLFKSMVFIIIIIITIIITLFIRYEFLERFSKTYQLRLSFIDVLSTNSLRRLLTDSYDGLQQPSVSASLVVKPVSSRSRSTY